MHLNMRQSSTEQIMTKLFKQKRWIQAEKKPSEHQNQAKNPSEQKQVVTNTKSISNLTRTRPSLGATRPRLWHVLAWHKVGHVPQPNPSTWLIHVRLRPEVVGVGRHRHLEVASQLPTGAERRGHSRARQQRVQSRHLDDVETVVAVQRRRRHAERNRKSEITCWNRSAWTIVEGRPRVWRLRWYVAVVRARLVQLDRSGVGRQGSSFFVVCGRDAIRIFGIFKICQISKVN